MNGDINGLFNRHCHNFAGRVKLRPTYEGVLAHVVPTLRQIFQRVPARSLASSADDRFAHFVAHTLPQLRYSGGLGSIIANMY
jgi:U3 small nucleolar RNA-associated protein 25